MKEQDLDLTENNEYMALKSLRRKNRRRNSFVALMALQVGSLLLSYYLGRSHK